MTPVVPHTIKGIKNIFANQFGISDPSETWITSSLEPFYRIIGVVVLVV